MAKSIKLTSGSILCGNPITFGVEPETIDGPPSFHRIKAEIECGISGGNYEVITMDRPVQTEGKTVQIDVSSALRSLRDAYNYTSDALTAPLVKFNVKVYDEYMTDGELHVSAPIYYPEPNVYLCALFGAFTDMERIRSSGSKDVQALSRKPTDAPHLAYVGEEVVHAVSYEQPQSLIGSQDLARPVSEVAAIKAEGLQTVGTHSVYAVPQRQNAPRTVFRFVNSFGMIESVSVPCVYGSEPDTESTVYATTCEETFNVLPQSAVSRGSDTETWKFSTDPLTRNWAQWYLHEFLRTRRAWMLVDGMYLPVVITVDDDKTTLFDRTKTDMYRFEFTAQLDVSGVLSAV